jgi:chemotaxis protein histidine kinase CheA
MDHDLDDLLPLFLSEARDRLDRITLFLVNLETDTRAAMMVKRELHGLKGASRMMGLMDLSKLCHQTEEMVESGEVSESEILKAVDQLVSKVTSLIDSPDQAREEAEGAPAAEQEAPALSGIELRVTRELLDDLTDRGSRLRVLAVRAGSLVERLYQLGRAAESGVSNKTPEQSLAALATRLRQLAIEVEGNHRTLVHHAEHNLDALLRLQMQPLRPFLLNLARHSRELARSLNKEVEVKIAAGDSQLDHRLTEALEEAFLHLVRNAVDHGIEGPEERHRLDKPEAGQIRLEAQTEGRRVQIKVSDDGAGIDPEKVVATAVDRGMLGRDEAAKLTPDEALQLVYSPGFSTRDEASTVSGRGVGMSAAAQAVRGCGGDIWIESSPGKGTTITFEVPVARRGERILILRVGPYWLGLPTAAARSFRRLTPEMVMREPGTHRLYLDNRVVTAHFLCDIFACEEAGGGVLIEGVLGVSNLAIVADAVVGEEEVLLRPLPAATRIPAMFDSMALLASGRSVPVLDPHRLGQRDSLPAATVKANESGRQIRVLLVDDSLVTREMISRLLEDGGLLVTSTSGADEALRLISEQKFDCVVTDIEMPGMDGLQLTRHLRETANLGQIPIVVVSTRDRAEDRLAGLEAGADAYVTKQSLVGSELISLIHRFGSHS